MNSWTGTVSKIVRACACTLAFCALTAGAATVKDIGIKTHYPWNGLVDVTYNLGGAENGSVYRVTAKVIVGSQTFENVYTEDVDGSKGYSFQFDAATALDTNGNKFTGRVEDARVVFTVDEPTYVAIDLTPGAAATKYPLTWYFGEYFDGKTEFGGETHDPNIDLYKTDRLLLKRVVVEKPGQEKYVKYVGLFEVTQRQYELVVGSNPAYYSLYSDATVPAETRQLVEWKRPVERLSYDILVAQEGFFDRLTRRTGLKLALPKKDEWQTAAYGNGDKGFNLGTGKYYDLAANMSLNTWLDPAPFRYGMTGNLGGNQNSDDTKGTAMVGSYDANDLGLYDMHGNVAEWTQTTELNPENQKTVGVLCGGDYVSKAEDCAADSTRTMAQTDGTQYYYTGFRVFGDEPDDSFEKEQTIESTAFAVDVDEDNIRQIRVEDNNDGTYTFYYTPAGGQGATERSWVTFDDAALFGGKDWKPTHHGDNVATNEADNTVTTIFRVTPLEISLTASPVTVTYDGEWHTIEGPDVSVPSYHGTPFKIVYWCDDNEAGHAKTENEASENKDDVHFINVKRALDNSVLSYAVWYKVTSPFYNTKAECQQLTINPRAVKNAQVKCKDTLTYNAKLQTNEVTDVSLLLTSPAKTLNLKIGTDYALDGNSGTDAQKYTMTLAGKGNYTGTLTKLWEILPLDFGDIKPEEGGSGTQEKKAARVNLVSDTHHFVYNGRPQTNYVLTVSINGVDLDPSSSSFLADQVTGNVATDVGTYKVIVTGAKNFKGQLTNEWTIVPMSITNATVYLDAEFDYNGDCQTRNVTNVTVATDAYTIPASDPAVPTAITIPSYTIDVPAAWYYVRGNTGTNASAKVGAYTLGVWAKSREGNNFCGHVYTNWFIGQRDLTNAVFTVDDAAAYDYVYNRTGKTPDATAKDAIDDGTHAIVPMISHSTNLVADLTNDWKIAEYLNNVNVEDGAKIVFAATENGNYRGVVTNDFETGVTPATISSVTITNAAAKTFVYDGTEKVVHRGDVLVTTENGLTLRNDAKPFEFKTSGQNSATATGRYKVTVTPQTPNFLFDVPNTPYDTWDIVPAAPVLTWTTPKGAQFVTNENGTVLFGVSDLTVAAESRCDGETLIYEFVTPSGRQPTVSGDKFHITERTTITARSVWTDTKTGLALTGGVTTVTLAPGQCADPKIYIAKGASGYVAADKFNRNNTVVTIEPSALVTVAPSTWPTNVLVANSTPFWPAWKRTTGTLNYWLLDASTNVIAAAGTKSFVLTETAWQCTNLTVSADTVFVVAQICDTNYTDSIVVTQQLTRSVGKMAWPAIKIEKVDAKTRKVTLTCSVAGSTIYYTTSNKVVNAESPDEPEAEKPTAECELGDEWAVSKAATTKYTEPFLVTLSEVDECVDVKAIAYKLTDDEKDFTARSEVNEKKSFREWHEGEALDAPDQVFTNGWTQLKVAQVDNPNPAVATDVGHFDTPWMVADDASAAGGECMRSGPLTNSNIRTSSLSTTVEGAGYVVFRWKANCEDDPTGETWDHGEFIVDGVVTQKIDGVTEWTPVAIKLTNGTHKLTWSYTKDFSKHGVGIEEGDDCVYLDSFLFVKALSFGDFAVTVDPLVFNYAFQLPTNETYAIGGKTIETNYIHATVTEPSTGIKIPLTQDVDYKVIGDAQRQAGEYTLKLQSIDTSYLVKGETNVAWKILPLDLTNAVVQVDATSLVYSGDPQTVTVTNLWAHHYRDGLVSVKDVKKLWSPKSATETVIGQYALTVVGSQNLTGTAPTVKWEITKKEFAGDIEIKVTPEAITYLEATPSVTVRDTVRSVDLTENVDYTLTWPADTVNVGEKTITVTGMGNYGGQTKTATYRITQRNIGAGKIYPTITSPVTYKGSAYENTYTVKDDLGSNLVENVDYKLHSDSDAISQAAAGTYTLKIEGIKNYWCSNQVTWTINPIDLPSANLTLVPATYAFEYDGTAKSVTGDAVTSASANGLAIQGYTVSCDEQTEKGDYTFTVTSTDPNFSGTSQPQAWSIGPRSITNATITLTTNLVWNGVTVITNNGQRLVRTVLTNATEQTMTFTVADKLNGTVTNLVLGTDYAIVPGTDKGTNACKYVLQITGLGNYAAATSNEWVIAPSLVTITPNVENPGTNEVIYAEEGKQRVQMERDDGDWTLLMRRTFFDDEGRETSSYVSNFRTFTVKQRTQVDGWAVTADGVTGSVRTVDFRIGHAKATFAVLADADNIPYLYEDGKPWTNTVDGAVITNFCHNGQLVYLTRGNLAVSNDVTGARILFTNATDRAYTDGILRYTIDGAEPTEESAAWTAESRIVISNTTTVLSKVFGGQFIDSPVVTNVFVRDMERYSAPKIEYLKYGTQDWLLATNGETVVFSVIGQKAHITDTNDVGGTIYWTTNGVTTNVYTEAISFDTTTTLQAWIGDQFDVHNYSNSPTVAVEFSCDTKLAIPVIAFSNATDVAVYQQDDKVFTNAYQYVQITRGGDTFTRYTDGEIWYKLDAGEWAKYVSPIQIWTNTTVYAIATNGTSGFAPSLVTNVVFEQVMKKLDDLKVVITNTPTVKQVAVTITNNTGNIVYYTLDGSDPIGVNASGVKNGEKFTETSKTFVRDIAIGETLVVKAIAYTEVSAGNDYIAVSAPADDAFTRNWTIGDSIKPDAPAKQWASNRPDASDLTFVNDDTAYDETNTAWVADETYFVATNAQGKGSSMRSGAARTGGKPGEPEPESFSILSTTVRGPGTLTFKWASSTEFDEGDSSQIFDVGTFYVDDVAVTNIWGTNEWKEITYTIVETNEVAQDHTLVWEYSKDWMDDEYIFEKYDIKDCIWVDEFVWTCVPDLKQCDAYVTPIVYDREIHLPTIVVTNRTTGVELTNGVDYVVEVTSTNKPGTFGYTLKGLGTTYTGTLTGTWKIDPLSLEGATVKLSEGQMYTCKDKNKITQYAVVESIKAKLGKREIEVADLVNEWTASGTNGIDAATYTATIVGNDGLLTGSVSTNWVIAPRPLQNNFIMTSGKLTYAGGAERTKKFSVVYGGVSLGSADYTLVEGTDKGTTVAGNTIQINAVEGCNFTGSAEMSWTMNPLDISAGTVNLNPTNLFFNTKEQYVAMTNVLVDLSGWTDNPISLTNELWKIEGTNGTDVGTYWVVVTPLAGGNLTGSPISNKWEMLPASIAACTVELEPYNTYNGSSIPQWQLIKSVTHPTLGVLTEGVDYKKYAKNANKTQAGKYTLEVEGIGNYCDTKPVYYEQLPAQIDSVVIDPASHVYDKTVKTQDPAANFTVKAGELTATLDTDYFVQPDSVLSETTAGVYTVTIKGSYDSTKTSGFTGNFVVPSEDEKTNVTWKILCCDMSNDVEIVQSADSFVYNREEQRPTVTVTSKLSGVQFVEGEDYEIDWPTDCVNASNLTYYVRGIFSVTNRYEMHYSITPATIDEMKFVAQKGKTLELTYNGTAQTVTPAFVKATGGGTEKLVLDESEYKLVNASRKDVGEYTASVQSASRNFVVQEGGVSDNWRITPKDISGSEVVVVMANDIVYTGKAQDIAAGNIQKVLVKSDSLIVDGCTVTSEKKTDAGNYSASVTTAGSENFTGTAEVQWTIKPRDITGATFTWAETRLLWNGQQQNPIVKTLSVPKIAGYDAFTIEGDALAGLAAYDKADVTEAGAYTSHLTATGPNYTGTTTETMPWEIVPRAPVIAPNDGTGKYTKLADWIAVEINNDTDDQLWKIYYTTNDWAETKEYPLKGNKFDITQHMVVQAYAVSCDGNVTSETSRCEYFFGKQNVAPTIALTAADGAEKGRPAVWEQDGRETVVTGAAQIVTFGAAGGVVTNFYHANAKVALTRFGAMTQKEIDETIEISTFGGNSPYTDGEIWYTMAKDDEPVYAPTNVAGVYGSARFVEGDYSTYPTLTTNTIIVARVFGKELENSPTVTNAFFRLWTTVEAPTVDPTEGSFQKSLTVKMSTNHTANADWWFTNGVETIYYTLDDNDPTAASTRYTNAFDVTWKDMLPGTTQVVVKAFAYAGEDFINSGVVTATYDHYKGQFDMPTLTESATFTHALPNGFAVSLTNNAPEGVGGSLMYQVNDGGVIELGDVPTYDFSVDCTSTVRVWVAATEDAHDYYTSETNEAIYTYKPYQMVAPVVDKESQTFYGKDFTYTISYPEKVPAAEDADHIYDGGDINYSTDAGTNWTVIAKTDLPKTFTISETTNIWIKQTLADHIDSEIVQRTYKRFVTEPTIKLVDADDAEVEPEIVGDKTNYYHKAFVAMACDGGDTHVEYTLAEDGKPVASGTFTEKIPVSGTFTVTAVAKTEGGSESDPVVATYTRQWERLVQPKIEIANPNGEIVTEVWNTGDRVAITNMESYAKHEAVAWPTNAVIKYAVYTNSDDIATEPASVVPYDRAAAFFKADTNAVWAVVEADDYLPSTNKTAFARQFNQIGLPTITFDNSVNRTNVFVTIAPPQGASNVYYTFELTNETSCVAEPVGNEYDVTKTSARYETTFNVVLKPDQTLIVKARAYVEDDSSERVGLAETNFTARGAVVTDAFTLPWTVGDALDAPDQTFVIYDTIARETNAVCVEDTAIKNYGDSSMVYTSLADSETVTITTEVTGPGTIAFDWRTRCEKGQHGFNRDYFTFIVDGVEVKCIDGSNDWTTVTHYISGLADAKHTLAWSYKKDASEKQLEDSVWLDHFQWVASDDGIVITDDMRDWARRVFGDDYVDTVLSPGGVDNYEEWTAALAFTAANGRSYYDCYVLGLDVDDVESQFVAGTPVLKYLPDPVTGDPVLVRVTISWTPCTVKGRTYSLVGKRDLILDGDWSLLNEVDAAEDDPTGGSIDATASQVEGYQYFQLRVRMTK